jgi:hypothetical protein
MKNEGTVEVERLGGFAGFGLPGAKLRSRGQLPLDQLLHVDSQALARLFAAPPRDAPRPDGFTYRLTLHTPTGTKTVEVAEQAVPQVLQACVSDELL